MRALTSTIFLCSFVFVIQKNLAAQDSLEFTLSGAIEEALSKNVSLKSEMLKRERIKYQKKEANSYFFPTITGSAGITHYSELPLSFLPANALNPNAISDEVVGLELGLANASDVGISAQWMLYNQSLFTSRKALEKQSEITELQIQQKEDELIYNVSLLYYSILFSEMQIKVIENNINSLKRILLTVESNYRNGLVNKTELDKVNVNILNLSSQLENFKYQSSSQRELLKLNLGLSGTESLKLIDRYSDIISFESSNLYEAKPPSSLLLVTKKRELSELQLSLEKQKRLPTLSMNFGASNNWLNNDLSDLYSADQSYPVVFTGLKLSVPILSGGLINSQIGQAKIDSQIIASEENFFRDKVEVDIKNAWNQYTQYLKTIETRKENVTLAKSIYDQSLLEYKQGLITLNQLLSNEISVRDSESQYLIAVSQSLSGLLAYKKAAGLIQKSH